MDQGLTRRSGNDDAGHTGYSTHQLLALLGALSAFNFWWYASFLSFPLQGEDGATNYSNLLEAIGSGLTFTTSFPIKWLEGMGQPNFFVSAAADPFAWLMWLPLPADDAFRFSMALRATVCWLGSFYAAEFMLGRNLARSVMAATACMALNFTCSNAWGVPSFAGIYNATHAALFPWMVAAVAAGARSSRRFSLPDAALVLLLVPFILVYPVGAVIGLVVLCFFAAILALHERAAGRLGGMRLLAKLLAMIGIILVAPPLSIAETWMAVSQLSARLVFAGELFSYDASYTAPMFWFAGPWAQLLCVGPALGVVLLKRDEARRIAPVVLTLVLIVAGVQLLTIARRWGGLDSLLVSLPRQHYFEFYLPLFYALAGAAVLGSAINGNLATPASKPAASHRLRRPALLALGISASMLATATAGVLWQPERVHPVFAATVRCAHQAFICADPAGSTMGAAASPITRFLAPRLGAGGEFKGRAETGLSPGPRFQFPVTASVQWTPALFDRLHNWYQRAYDSQAGRKTRLLGKHPREYRWEERELLRRALQTVASNSDVSAGVMPDDVITEILAWAQAERPDHRRPAVVTFADAHEQGLPRWQRTLSRNEVALMVEERDRNFRATGNGMMLRALPFQGIPVATAYDQSLDFLYYLFWSRYVNSDTSVERSINLTTLGSIHLDRLALLGVRYLIRREHSFAPPINAPKIYARDGYAIYEIPNPNLAGVFPRRILTAASLAQELALMRSPEFDSARDAVVSAADQGMPSRAVNLQPVRSRIQTGTNEIIFEADTAGPAFVVLPFRYSHCWEADFGRFTGRLVRVDAGLLGIAFEGTARATLRWRAGYGRAECMQQDAGLIEAARAAAGASH
jgi:hypothetical protein